MNLRPYQQELKNSILSAWASGAKNVMPVMPTGSGKTLTVADIMNDHRGAGISIAHRSELISQMSLAFARFGIRHRVIGPAALSRICTSLHLAEFGRNFIDPNARMCVSSAQTLVRYDPEPWMLEVTKWACDEAHHVLLDNTWGKVLSLFPNAVGLMPTATPCRADGKGLGRHADGMADVIVLGPTMRDLIKDGWLSDYRIFAPPSDIDISHVPVSASGDFSPPKLSEAIHKSRTIVGDVVAHYKRIAMGKLGITFAVDIAAAIEISLAFKAAGVPAEVISGKTPPLLRANLMRRFRNKEFLQLINVEVLGEGTDVPAVEVISDVAHTMSYRRFVQRFGRMLRPLEGKTHGIYIDHVANTLRHGLPDAPRTWTLDRREKRTRSAPDDVIPIRVCAKCLSAYERIYAACPYCGEHPVPAVRSSPAEVDGDLSELSPEVLARLRGEVAAAESAPAIPYGASPEIAGSLRKHYWARRDAQTALRSVMALWGGWRVTLGESESKQQRRFYFAFGTDVLSAQTLGRADAEALRGRVRGVLERAGVVAVNSEGETK